MTAFGAYSIVLGEPKICCASCRRRPHCTFALDARASQITEEMKAVAARAIADVVSPDELHPAHIIPSVFDPDVAPAVARAVTDATDATGDDDG